MIVKHFMCFFDAVGLTTKRLYFVSPNVGVSDIFHDVICLEIDCFAFGNIVDGTFALGLGDLHSLFEAIEVE